MESARRYYLSRGTTPINMRGMGTRLLTLIQTYGAVPFDAYHAYHPVNYNVVARKLQLASRSTTNFNNLDSRANSILDEAIGYLPGLKVYMLGAAYTPLEFAHSVCQEDEYQAITSFTHHPFGSHFVLEVPDNVNNDRVLNVPLDTMMQFIVTRLRSGRAVFWEGDVSSPGFDAADGPAGHVEGHVVIAAVAAPDGEAQVVADLQQDAYAAEGDDHATCAARVVTVLAAVGEEVALVVRLHAAVGVDEAEAVVVTTAIFHGQRSGHSRAACRRLTHHPAERLAVGLFGHALGMRRETGGEHLRQHVEVGARPTVDGRLRLPHVLRWIGPGNVLLQDNRYVLDRKVDARGLFQENHVFFKDKQRAHTQFWSLYQRPPREEYWAYIIDRRDLLVPQDVRERKGSFFTPQQWVELSQQYIADVLGENWQEEYYVWDCAAGTGNLLNGLTNKYHIWASSLDPQDVQVMKDRIANGANLLESHVFQFDFLNDEFDKLPAGLQEIINDPQKRRKLVVYINPPYAECGHVKNGADVYVSSKNVGCSF